jgi:predicted alpha/beta-fold hydrolase
MEAVNEVIHEIVSHSDSHHDNCDQQSGLDYLFCELHNLIANIFHNHSDSNLAIQEASNATEINSAVAVHDDTPSESIIAPPAEDSYFFRSYYSTASAENSANNIAENIIDDAPEATQFSINHAKFGFNWNAVTDSNTASNSSHLIQFLVSIPLQLPAVYYQVDSFIQSAIKNYVNTNLSLPLLASPDTAQHYSIEFHYYSTIEWPFNFELFSIWSLLFFVALFSSIYALIYFFFLIEKPRVYSATSVPVDNIIRRILEDENSVFRRAINKYYYFTPYLFNGHAQTAFSAKGGKLLNTPLVEYEREILPVSTADPLLYNGEIALDWCVYPCPKKPYTNLTPTIVILHGLAGGSAEHYIKNQIFWLISRLSVRCVVINQRGCGGQNLSSPQAYCGAYTEDTAQAIAHISQRLPHSRLFALGFSLGANLLTKYCGEMGDNSKLTAAVALGNPFDFLLCSKMLEYTWFRRNFYSKGLCANMIKLFSGHREVFSQDSRIDFKKLLQCKLLREFDTELTAKTFNYYSCDHYYREATSAAYLPLIKVPFLALNARDDPISNEVCLPLEEIKAASSCILLTTAQGGHSMDWFEGFFSRKSYATRITNAFLKQAIDCTAQGEQGLEVFEVAQPPPLIQADSYEHSSEHNSSPNSHRLSNIYNLLNQLSQHNQSLGNANGELYTDEDNNSTRRSDILHASSILHSDENLNESKYQDPNNSHKVNSSLAAAELEREEMLNHHLNSILKTIDDIQNTSNLQESMQEAAVNTSLDKMIAAMNRTKRALLQTS